MTTITTDDLYRYFVEQNRPLMQRDIAEKFGIEKDLVNRLMRMMVEREKRIKFRRLSACRVEYEAIAGKGDVAPTKDYMTGWGNAPRLG